MFDAAFERTPTMKPYMFTERRIYKTATFYELEIGCIFGVLYLSVEKRHK